jgi:hypothetical protein
MAKSNPAIGMAQNAGKGIAAMGRGGAAMASKVISHMKGGVGKA